MSNVNAEREFLRRKLIGAKTPIKSAAGTSLSLIGMPTEYDAAGIRKLADSQTETVKTVHKPEEAILGASTRGTLAPEDCVALVDFWTNGVALPEGTDNADVPKRPETAAALKLCAQLVETGPGLFSLIPNDKHAKDTKTLKRGKLYLMYRTNDGTFRVAVDGDKGERTFWGIVFAPETVNV